MAKIVIVVTIVFVGLALYGRATGRYIGTIDVLNLNQIGQKINAAQQTLSQQRAPAAGFSRPNSQ